MLEDYVCEVELGCVGWKVVLQDEDGQTQER